MSSLPVPRPVVWLTMSDPEEEKPVTLKPQSRLMLAGSIAILILLGVTTSPPYAAERPDVLETKSVRVNKNDSRLKQLRTARLNAGLKELKECHRQWLNRNVSAERLIAAAYPVRRADLTLADDITERVEIFEQHLKLANSVEAQIAKWLKKPSVYIRHWTPQDRALVEYWRLDLEILLVQAKNQQAQNQQ